MNIKPILALCAAMMLPSSAYAAAGTVPIGTSAISVTNIVTDLTAFRTNFLTNIVYVPYGRDISNVFANARSGTTLELDSGTNLVRGKLTLVLVDYGLADTRISNINNITIRGSGNTVIHATNDGVGFGIYNCSNVLFQDITFRGYRTNGTSYDVTGYGAFGLVQAFGTNHNITFENCNFESNNFFGLNMACENGGHLSRNIDTRVINCNFLMCGHSNFVGSAANPDGGGADFFPNVIMEHCNFDRCGRGVETFATAVDSSLIIRDTIFRNVWARAIHCQSTTLGNRFLIDGCHFFPDPNARKSSTHIVVETGAGGTITHCLFTNITVVGDFPIYVGGPPNETRNVDIINNIFENIDTHAIWYDAVRGGSIRENRFIEVDESAALFGGSEIEIANNHFWNVAKNGGPVLQPQATGSTNNAIRDNFFIRTAGGSPSSFIGLSAEHRDTLIRGNTFYDVSGAVPAVADSGVNTRWEEAPNNRSRQVLGAGTGSTNYTLLATDARQYLGSSNVSITAVMNYQAGVVRPWTAYITNLSAATWGFRFPATTNRVIWWGRQGGGTNAPTVLTNNTCLRLEGSSDGTNTFVTYEYFRPGL